MTLDNLIQAGTVVEADSAKALVKVDVLGAVSAWLPVVMQASSFKKHWVGLRVGMQVVVFANRYVLGSIYNQDCAEPNGASDNTDIMEYEDGTRVVYDSTAKTLTIDCVGDIQIKAVNARLEAESATVIASKVDVQSTDIQLNGGAGVVTGAHICAATGLPHADCSSTVLAGA